MPQLEQIHTYLSQVFWLAISFATLLVLMWRVGLPRVSTILQNRQDRIDGDLRRAEEIKKDAEATLAAYERTMAEGRSKAQAELRAAADQLAREAAERHAALAQRLAREGEEAERRIDAARLGALADLESVAADLARSSVQRLIGVDVTAAQAEAAARATGARR